MPRTTGEIRIIIDIIDNSKINTNKNNYHGKKKNKHQNSKKEH